MTIVRSLQIALNPLGRSGAHTLRRPSDWPWMVTHAPSRAKPTAASRPMPTLDPRRCATVAAMMRQFRQVQTETRQEESEWWICSVCEDLDHRGGTLGVGKAARVETSKK